MIFLICENVSRWVLLMAIGAVLLVGGFLGERWFDNYYLLEAACSAKIIGSFICLLIAFAGASLALCGCLILFSLWLTFNSSAFHMRWETENQKD